MELKCLLFCSSIDLFDVKDVKISMERHFGQNLRFIFMTYGRDFITSGRDFHEERSRFLS